MGRAVISSRALQRLVLVPQMEAIAVGLAEEEVLVDELVPVLPEVLGEVRPAERRVLLHCARAAIRLGSEELAFVRQATGAVDDLVIDLHALELAGGGVGQLGVLATASRLRGVLGILLAGGGGDPLELADAVRDVDDVLRAAPRAQIFSASLRTNLGGEKYRLLEALDAGRRARLGLPS